MSTTPSLYPQTPACCPRDGCPSPGRCLAAEVGRAGKAACFGFHAVLQGCNVTPFPSLISRMLQRDPKQRASLEQIEGHSWLQGVDPSPASRSLLPLTSHKRVSEEEHEIILQAMVCGNIADRDTIQE